MYFITVPFFAVVAIIVYSYYNNNSKINIILNAGFVN